MKSFADKHQKVVCHDDAVVLGVFGLWKIQDHSGSRIACRVLSDEVIGFTDAPGGGTESRGAPFSER